MQVGLKHYKVKLKLIKLVCDTFKTSCSVAASSNISIENDAFFNCLIDKKNFSTFQPKGLPLFFYFRLLKNPSFRLYIVYIYTHTHTHVQKSARCHIDRAKCISYNVQF